jgi:hypothetical protein
MAKISISWRQKVLKSPRTPAFSDPNLIPDDDMLKAIGYIATVAAGIEDILHGIIGNMLAYPKRRDCHRRTTSQSDDGGYRKAGDIIESQPK